MTYDEARAEFIQKKQNGADPLMVRLGMGPAPKDADDFIVVDRHSWFIKEIQEGKRTICCP